jgi:hypothetical protein
MCEACGRNGGVFWRKGPFSLTPARVRWERGRHRPVPALKGRPMKARGEAPGLGVHANISSPARATHAGTHPNAFADGLSRPFRAVWISSDLIPGALPRAITVRPFRAWVRWERGRHRPMRALKGRPMKARGEAPGLGVHANISSPARVTHAGAHPNAFAGGLSRPFRAVRIDFGLDTRGVAPGYHSAPFQGCPGLSVP